MGSAAHQYLRVSTTQQRSNPEQDADNRAAADHHGWNIGRTYEDTGSASRYSKKKRDDFERLVADLRAGAIPTGDVLFLWESSRGSRKQAEWATLLDLLQDNGIRLHVTSHGRTYDLSNARDRRTLDEDGTDSAYESAKNSARITRTAGALAKAGMPIGKPPYGYVRTYDPSSGKLTGQVIDPERAPVIEELFERLEAGDTLTAISKDYAARGITNKSGRPVSREQLRDYAMKPAYAGLREHTPVSGEPGGLYPATWPAIVPPRRFWAVNKILKAPERVTNSIRTTPGRARWLLSMFTTCHVCDSSLVATYPNPGRGVRKSPTPRYRCQKAGHVVIMVTELDAVAEAVIIKYLSSKKVAAKLHAAWGKEDERLARVRDQLADARAELRNLAAAVGANTITLELAGMAEPGIRARIAGLESQEAELSVPAELRGLVGDDVLTNWRSKPLSARRRVARMLLVPEHLGQLRVDRLTTGQRIVFRKATDGMGERVRPQDALAAAELPVEGLNAGDDVQVRDKSFAWTKELQDFAARYSVALAAHDAPEPTSERTSELAALLKPAT